MTVSKTRLLSFAQCPRQVWLAQYSPELEAESRETERRFATGRAVGGVARHIYGSGGGHHVKGNRGLRAAIAATAELLEAGGVEPIFEATFDHDGVVVSIDVLLRDGTGRLGIVEVKSSTKVKQHHVLDVAIQAWVLEQLGHEVDRVAVAHVDGAFVYGGGGDYSGLLVEHDLTDEIATHTARVAGLVRDTRATLALLDEPEAQIGVHCDTPYACAFFGHCAPPQREFPVAALGGSRELVHDWMRRGLEDLRDVPEPELTTDRQRLIYVQTRDGRPRIDVELGELARGLGYPRYFLDFETIAFAVPIWAGTRPYEALPFQWSCHVDRGAGPPAHEAFLDTSGAPPMRSAAESLIAALGESGPVVVYSGYEGRVLDALAERFADLAPALGAIRQRLVDLLPPLRAHYYDPRMRGSWSIKAVLPTVAPELDYASLGDIADGDAAQAAYLAAIEEGVSAGRRDELRSGLLEYCRYDTLALFEIVSFLSRV